jgi:hypothetical protein
MVSGSTYIEPLITAVVITAQFKDFGGLSFIDSYKKAHTHR